MKLKGTLFLLVLLFVFNGWSQDYGGERIVHFHSDIEVKKNRKVIVTETIQVRVEGDRIKRGIFRSIPLQYVGNFENYTVSFELLSVKRNGENEPYHTEWADNGIIIYVGEESVLLEPAFYTYEVKYELDYVVQMFSKVDELYWNVNGNGWDFSFDSISATVYLPEGASVVQYSGNTGSYGALDKSFTVQNDSSSITFATNRKMYAGEGLSVAVGWDKGHILPMTSGEKLQRHLWLYALLYLGLLTLTIGFGFNFFMWWKYGRDPKPGTIIPRFYAPEGMSPAECAYLDNEGREIKEMYGATILGLATKGKIEIERKGKGKYLLTKTKQDSKPFDSEPEENFFKQLMRKDTISLNKGDYNERLKKAYDNLPIDIDNIQKNQYYVRNTRLKWLQYIFPAITLIAGLVGYVKLGGNFFIPIGFTLLHIVINFIFARLYEQPTPKGRRMMDEIQGFKMYISYADKDRIKTMNRPEMNFEHFEKNLPYAVAFGFAKEWTAQFDTEIIENLGTSMPYLYGVHFLYAGSAFSDFGNDISSTISSAATPPTSSGSGGSFSGGGGFSGGGFGGGGGGGW